MLSTACVYLHFRACTAGALNQRMLCPQSPSNVFSGSFRQRKRRLQKSAKGVSHFYLFIFPRRYDRLVNHITTNKRRIQTIIQPPGGDGRNIVAATAV